MTVNAEGVEHEPQAEFLRTLNCHEIQGFLYGRPATPEDFEQNWLKPAASEVA
jgi:EAL domain-containing protein (putative c-di-GMP-specific phosphodiesterase class I)